MRYSIRLFISLVLVNLLSLAQASEHGEVLKFYPCEKETNSLMSISTPWAGMFNAAIELPPNCFDGYFAEGISDAIARKMGKDWNGFMRILQHNAQDEIFFSLVLQSINATLNPDDIHAVNQLAKTSCIKEAYEKCLAISNQIKQVLDEY